jgi:hypothetical protein
MTGWMAVGLLGLLLVYALVVWIVARTINTGLADDLRARTGRGPR